MIAKPERPCPFCAPDRPVLCENALAWAFYDINPVSPGHALVVPKRHFRTVFDLPAEDYAACFALVRDLRAVLVENHEPDGFNVGVNCEPAGGQSVWHAHIHVIPRYTGDVERPLGGVRNVIPWKKSPA